ncbi:MAG TPA: hypothetical protein PKY81_12605 [bacterium]|nr:hypothetical protein [bacterium]
MNNNKIIDFIKKTYKRYGKLIMIIEFSGSESGYDKDFCIVYDNNFEIEKSIVKKINGFAKYLHLFFINKSKLELYFFNKQQPLYFNIFHKGNCVYTTNENLYKSFKLQSRFFFNLKRKKLSFEKKSLILHHLKGMIYKIKNEKSVLLQKYFIISFIHEYINYYFNFKRTYPLDVKSTIGLIKKNSEYHYKILNKLISNCLKNKSLSYFHKAINILNQI